MIPQDFHSNPPSRAAFNVLLAIALVGSCSVSQVGNSGAEGTSSAPPPAPGSTVLEIDLSSPKSIDQTVVGFNGTNLPEYLTAAKPADLDRYLADLRPQVLRFPGGTIANFYHPDETGYGFRDADQVAVEGSNVYKNIHRSSEKKGKITISENYRVAFANTAKSVGAEVLYVANLLNGTLDETMATLDFFAQQGVTVAGVELGNEYYLRAYNRVFPDVGPYITTARSFAKAIRAKYPRMKIGVVAAPAAEEAGKKVSAKRMAFFKDWNDRLARETFYDAYITHLYAVAGKCEKDQDPGQVFPCAAERFSHYTNHQLAKVINSYRSVYGTQRKVWITEWNLKNAFKLYGNTFLQAQYTADMVFNFIDINQALNGTIEYATYHNLCSGSYGFALITPTRAQDRANAEGSNYMRRASYYAMLYLNRIHTDNAQLVGASALEGAKA
ncbi:MAG: hypothetical protein AAGB22_05360, partial [Bacteroidota bacterium]